METTKKILLVEDDQNFGVVLRDYLSLNDFEVTLAKNGMEGFEKFKKDNYDLCILDVMMPYKDGYTLAKEIREKRANWFNTFLDTKPEVNEAELFNFHRYTEEENTEHGLVINRNDALKTLSITQAVVEKNKVQMTHYDLMKNDSFNHAFIII